MLVIQSFADKETQKVFNRERTRRFHPELARRALRKLLILDGANDLDDLRLPPGNRRESLVGNRIGQHSIRINDQWRICFRWEHDGPHEVEITDYH